VTKATVPRPLVARQQGIGSGGHSLPKRRCRPIAEHPQAGRNPDLHPDNMWNTGGQETVAAGVSALPQSRILRGLMHQLL